jgi:hypothetical protein
LTAWAEAAAFRSSTAVVSGRPAAPPRLLA